MTAVRLHRILIAEKELYQGDVIHILKGDILSERSRTSIQVPDGHIEDDLFKYANHSFNPNVAIDGYKVVALWDIEEGEEITFDYHTTESHIAFPFQDRETGRMVQ